MIHLGLPAYNEQASIDPLFARIAEAGNRGPALSVLLFDDGSTDETVALASRWQDRLDVSIIKGGVNQGLGWAIRNLMLEFLARSSPGDSLVIMDCDDTHDPGQIREMLSVAESVGPNAVIVASRYRRGSSTFGVPMARRIPSFCLRMLYRVVLPIDGVRDYSCGFRLYTHHVVKAIAVSTGNAMVLERGFACMPEVLVRASITGAVVREIPMILRYDRKSSESKMDVSSNSIRLLAVLWKWRRLRDSVRRS